MGKYDLIKLIPQRNPMIFLSDVEEFDYENQILVARTDVQDSDLLFDKNLGGIPSSVSLEYMAQAVACYIGLRDLHDNPNASPGIGFVLGSRKMSVLKPVYLDNHSYFIKVVSMFCDQNIASFDCQIVDKAGDVWATGVLNAFRPDDINNFMENINE